MQLVILGKENYKMDKSINEKILSHHQKVIDSSKRLLNPSKEEKIRLTQISSMTGLALIALSIPVLLFNRIASLGLVITGIIQFISARFTRKYW